MTTERPRSRRFLENVGWSLLKQAATLLMSFFLTPVLVHGLGKEGYALYSLIGVILGGFSILALGAGAASVKFAAEAASVKDARRLRDAFRHSLLMHTVLPVAGALALAAAAAHAASLFAVPAELAETSVRLFRWVALGAACFIAGQAGLALLVGLDRFGLSNLIESVLALALLGGSALLVHFGYGLDGIGPWFTAANAVFAACALGAAVATLRTRAAHPGPLARPLPLREFAGYCLPLLLTHVLWMLNFQADKVLIAALLPLSSLTYYAIAFSLISRLEALPRSISFAVFQMAGEMSGLGHAAPLKRLYLKATKLIGLTLAPAVVLLFAFAPQFLTLWLGPEFSDQGTWPLRLLLAGSSCYFLTLNPLSIAQGIGKPYYAVCALAASACISFALWSVFIPRYGILGAAGGFLASQASVTAALLFFFHREAVPVRPAEFFVESLKTPLISGGVLLIAAMLIHPAADTWPRLILTVAAGTALSYGVSLALLHPEEKELLRRFLARRRGADVQSPPA